MGLIAGAGPPLLFLHGGDYVAQNRGFLDVWRRRFRVIAPRHPGFGHSPRPTWFRSVHDHRLSLSRLLDRRRPRETAAGRVVVGRLGRARNGGALGTSGSRHLVLIDSLGVKFGGREERDIADIYALPADEVLRRTFADPAAARPDYSHARRPRGAGDRARPRGGRALRLEALHAQPGARALAAPHRGAGAGAVGREGRHRRALIWRKARRRLAATPASSKSRKRRRIIPQIERPTRSPPRSNASRRQTGG